MKLKEELDETEKEICQEIREQLPGWDDQDDKFIYNFCGAVSLVEELIGNKGYRVKEAVAKVAKGL